MARTKQTLNCDASNPPKDLKCGICGDGYKKGFKSMLETMKPCSVCKVLFPIHHRCAKTFFKKVSKATDIFEASKFTNAKFKLFCKKCHTLTCPICGKDHPLGSNGTHIVVCAARHWFSCPQKCLPESQLKASPNQEWICPLHQKQSPAAATASPEKDTNKNSSSATVPRKSVPLLKSDAPDEYHFVTKWYEGKRTGSLSMLHRRDIPFAIREKMDIEFDEKVLTLTHQYNKKDDVSKVLTLIDCERFLNKDFVAKCDKFEDNNHSLLNDRSLLPNSLTVGAIKRLRASKGTDAYLNDELIYLFKIFLQENEIVKDPNNVPHVYLPSSYEEYLHPPVDKYPSTDFKKVIDKNWIKDSSNRTQFCKEYSAWFESTSKGRLDIVFDIFKSQGKVS